jgi:glutamyl-tRNA reductase
MLAGARRRASSAAAGLAARPLTLDELPAALDQADATIIALRTRAPLLAADQLAASHAGTAARDRGPVASPRGRAAAGALPHVSLVDVDTLGGAGRDIAAG